MINYTEKGQIIFDTLKKYIKSKADFDVTISQNLLENQYPLIIFEENSNTLGSYTTDRYRMNSTRQLSYTITIMAIDTDEIDGIDICEILAQRVIELMEIGYNFKGGIYSKFSNVTKARSTEWTLKFNGELDLVNDIIY